MSKVLQIQELIFLAVTFLGLIVRLLMVKCTSIKASLLAAAALASSIYLIVHCFSRTDTTLTHVVVAGGLALYIFSTLPSLLYKCTHIAEIRKEKQASRIFDKTIWPPPCPLPETQKGQQPDHDSTKQEVIKSYIRNTMVLVVILFISCSVLSMLFIVFLMHARESAITSLLDLSFWRTALLNSPLIAFQLSLFKISLLLLFLFRFLVPISLIFIRALAARYRTKWI